jgi:hypothetical protein
MWTLSVRIRSGVVDLSPGLPTNAGAVRHGVEDFGDDAPGRDTGFAGDAYTPSPLPRQRSPRAAAEVENKSRSARV